MDRCVAGTWTGRLELPVVGFNGYPIGRLELVLRLDTVDVWLHHRHLATHDRAELRAWLRTPEPELRLDDVSWAMVGQELTLSAGTTMAYTLPTTFVADLARLL